MKKSQIYICSDCKHIGPCKVVKKGSRKTEIFWWIMFSPVAICYSIYRLFGSKRVCEKCESQNIVKTNSKLIAEINENKIIDDSSFGA
ncbi:MAG: hypothetical protein FJX30_03880 [Alphaproteobacteria bacterium]|nr:hypothetical protein [Alphaproteobacteria bacterium]